MFERARLKLTILYLAIIMIVSVAFSTFIYRMVSFEIERRMYEIERRLELKRFGFIPPPGQSQLFYEDVSAAKKQVLLVLVYTNVVILIFSSAAGYLLAGITLRPIEEVHEQQKRFIADASHELKTPLTALQTSIEVALRDKKITLKNALFTLSDSLSDIKNMTNLTNNLLTLTKYQQNSTDERFEKVNLQEVVSETIKKISPLAKMKKIKIISNINNINIKGDKGGLEKLITILVDNAIKYSRDGGQVEIRAVKKRNNVVIEVEDQGIGIGKRDIPHIFERFYRSDVSRNKDSGGFGLGLSIAKSIVEEHGGAISVKSELGKGSTFIVKLPREQSNLHK